MTGAKLETSIDETFAQANQLNKKMKNDPVVAKFIEKVTDARKNAEMIVQLGHESLLPHRSSC